MQNYRVRVERTDSSHARASVREFELRLGARRADPTAGFNPVETLLSALGDCLLTALDFVAELSKVPLTGAWIELEATRQDKPPSLTRIHYTLHLAGEAPKERLERLVGLTERNSTVFQTLSQALPIEGSWERDS
jgi:putative redox protein